jgi:uncharacterized protein YecE (DUF72 family)
LHLGTCGFTAAGWVGSFYPRGFRSGDFLRFYAEELETVELDVTWYRTPTPEMISGWRSKTPPGFVFAAKVPQIVTHDKVLVDCRAELRGFLNAMAGLDEKLGPLLFQFPRFDQGYFASLDDFLVVLAPFLRDLPRGFRFALEVRNREWLQPKLLDLLARRGVAFAWTDHSRMPGTAETLRRVDPVTADFVYLRWLGDRYGIERLTTTWDRTILDRAREIEKWGGIVRDLRRRDLEVFGYVNNHYAGHAPATVRSLLDAIEPSLRRPRPRADGQRTLFEL